MRPTHINPKISHNTYLHGKHDFNCVPMAPPGTLTIILGSTETRASLAPNGVKGWYVIFLPDRYICFDIWCSNTRRIRQGETSCFFPDNHLLPGLSPHKTSTREAQQLTVVLRHSNPASTITKFGVDQQNALQKLGNFFQIATTPHAIVPAKKLPTRQIGIPTIPFMPHPVMTQPHVPVPHTPSPRVVIPHILPLIIPQPTETTQPTETPTA